MLSPPSSGEATEGRTPRLPVDVLVAELGHPCLSYSTLAVEGLLMPEDKRLIRSRRGG